MSLNAVYTDSKAKEEPTTLPEGRTDNYFRVINDAVYAPVVDYYRRLKNSFELKYPKLFALGDNIGFHNFYSKNVQVTEVVKDPSKDYILCPGDVITFANAQDVIDKFMKTMPWERSGLTFFGGQQIIELQVFGESLYEVVISPNSKLVGLSVLEASNLIYRRYMSAVLSTRSSSLVMTDRTTLSDLPR